MIDIVSHLDKKYLVNYRMKLREIPPEEVELVKNRTASPVVIQTRGELLFAEEIHDIEFTDVTEESSDDKSDAPPKEDKPQQK